MKPVVMKLRVVFMGTSYFAEKILSAMIGAQYNIISVYTLPDKKNGRNQKLQKTPVKIIAEKRKIPIFEPLKFDRKVVQELKDQRPDLIVVAAYGKIITKEMLKIPKFKCLNVHASLLPKFRGPSPIQNALLCGEKETGITIMVMDEGIDTGGILSKKNLMIEKDDTYPKLLEKLSKLGAELLLETIPFWIEKKITPKKQDNSRATRCQLIKKSDGKIIWSDDAELIYNRYRAFLPWPGIFSHWKQNEKLMRIKLNKISLIKNDPKIKHRLGEVFRLSDKIGVQSAKGVIIIEEIQLEGKNKMNIKNFLNGYPNLIGSILE